MAPGGKKGGAVGAMSPAHYLSKPGGGGGGAGGGRIQGPGPAAPPWVWVLFGGRVLRAPAVGQGDYNAESTGGPGVG